MARTQTMVQLSEDLLETLDRAADRRGASRSALIRELLWQSLAEDRHVLVGERIAAGYRRVPPGEPDDWGDLGAGADASTEEVLRRLDAEERLHGHDPW
ncbi:MAG TPA: CopG family transcriptional regulator [Thermoleophilaceae bacterium]|nr:CopG family transcriptional regulator [Thermoleophilaceae bacterium]